MMKWERGEPMDDLISRQAAIDGITFTLLVDEDGSPLIWDGE